MAASLPERGTHRLEHYVLLDRLDGRAGRVWRARRRSDDLPVIIRIFAARDEAERRMVLAAAERASRLCHGAAARVLDFGRADRAVFVVSELAPGQPLDRWTERTGIPPIESAIAIVQQIGRALAEAHEQGVTHHVLTPRNVFVVQPHDEVPAAKLVDLGLAQCLWPWPPPLSTVLFLAPEQLSSMLSARVYASASASMNQYSCAAVLYDLCTGGPPIVAGSVGELLQAHASRDVVPPSRINPRLSPALDHALLRALSRDPAQRFAQLGDFINALTRLPSATSNSGVRFIGVGAPEPVPPHALDGSDARTTWDAAFEERPTSETPLQALLARAQAMQSLDEASAEQLDDDVLSPAFEHEAETLPPPAAMYEAEPSVASWPAPHDGPAAPSSPRSSRPPRAPIGSFSSAPPASAEPAAPSGARLEPLPLLEVSPVALRSAGARLGLVAALGLGAAALVGLGLLLFSGPRSALRAASESELRVAPTVIVTAGANADARARADAPAPAVESAVARLSQPPASSDSTDEAITRAPSPSGRTLTRPRAALARQVRSPRPVVKTPRAPAVSASTSANTRASRVREPSALAVAVEREAAVAAEPTALDEPVDDQPPAIEQEDSARERRQPEVERAPAVRAAPGSQREAFSPDAFTMQVGEIEVRGSLPNSIVKRGIERIKSRLRACYRDAAKRARRHGYDTLRVSVEVDEHGRAENPRSRGGSLPGLDACVADAALRIASRTAPDTGTVMATFSLRFSP